MKTMTKDNGEWVGAVTIRGGYGFWDVTRYPRGGKFCRDGEGGTLSNVSVVSRYETGEVKEFRGNLPDGRIVQVNSECCDF